MALSFYNLDNNEEALRLCQQAQHLNYEDPAVEVLTGSILDEMGKTDEAIEVLLKAMKKWPYNQNLLYNLAVCYINQNNPIKAEQLMQQSIRYNPYHAGAHLALAKANYQMGRTAQAYLAFNMAMLMNPRLNNIAAFESVITGKSNLQSQPWLYPYPAGQNSKKWDELRLLLQSEMAFNSGFEYSHNISYITTRQSLMLFRKMKFEPADTSIYNQLYVRFFSELMKRGEYETYINYIFKNINEKRAQEWIAKNENKSKQFVNWALSAFNKWKSHGYSIDNENQGIQLYHFADNGDLEQIGKLISGKNEIREGKWCAISSQGALEAVEYYKNNQLQGERFIYDPSGVVRQHLNFQEGAFDGICKTFHPNGATDGIYPMKKGFREGVVENFNSAGMLVSTQNYKNNLRNGEATYTDYQDGIIENITFNNDTATGPMTVKYITGTQKQNTTYLNGMFNGTFNSWYLNGKPEKECLYIKGVRTGKLITYHPNGTKDTEAENNEKGNLTGKFLHYHRNGYLISEETGYDDGIFNGNVINYFPDGKIQSEHTYIDDRPVKTLVYDHSGNLLYQAQEKDSSLYLKDFYPDGTLKNEGLMVNGKRHGKWVLYNPIGIEVSRLHYEAGLQSGPQITFHSNGKPKTEFTSDSNYIVGRYTEYHPNGKVKMTGHYNKAGQMGEWLTYYINDSLETRAFYNDGLMVGRVLNYSPMGILTHEMFYDNEGNYIRTIHHNHLGQIITDANHQYGDHTFTANYPNGKTWISTGISSNLLHGTSQIFYPNGKLKTETPYLYGRPHGTIKHWDYNGQSTFEINYIFGMAEGKAVWYENGKTDAVSHFENNIRQGVSTSYFPNGKPRRVMHYEDGERDGISDYYAPDGSHMYRLRHIDGVLKGYSYKDRSGAFMPETNITTATNSITCYYATGQISFSANFKNGFYHGKVTSYYPNGVKMFESDNEFDDYNGKTVDYYSNGKVRESISYSNDIKHGQYLLYHENGILKMEGTYCAGNETGEWKVFNDSGKHVETLKYHNGDLYEIAKHK
jgi:antitoxin component YwqK of YwqJK toxin-antitoxin module